MGDTHFPDYNQRTTRQSIGTHDRNRSVISSIIEPKLCVFCRRQFDSDDYPDHVVQCTQQENVSSSPTVPTIHTESIDNSPSNRQSPTNTDEDSDVKFSTPRGNSPIMNELIEDDVPYSKLFNKSKLNNHPLSRQSDSSPTEPCDNASNMDLDDASESNSLITLTNSLQTDRNPSIEPDNLVEKRTKYCVLCSETINESDFEEHMLLCSSEPPTSPSTHNKSDSNFNVTEYSNEVYERSSPWMIVKQDSITDSRSTTTEIINCILCSKPIAKSEFESHVYACLSESEMNEPVSNERKRSNTSTSSSKSNKKPLITLFNTDTEPIYSSSSYFKPIDQFDYEENLIVCFSCQRVIKPDDKFSKEIPCPFRHSYCVSCLQQSMEEFARNRSVPMCHPTRCDYELSKYDISSIPLERRISDRLVNLAKGQQRPQCPKCRFYVNINEIDDYYEHTESCGDLIPCEYCSCPYVIEQIDDHTKKCGTDKTSQNEKLTNFVMTRTKYPFTKEQIYRFIQERKKDSAAELDPFSIIDALAIFGSHFLLDMPTRDCDVCMEARPYEDIYVFGCQDCHKLCYSCYYQSCETKMSNGEILTCGLCANPLQDGELNQLRVSGELLQKFRDYQMKKTFDAYSNRTRGVIKCPNQNCTWIAEAADPNERFKVECPLCKKEFCSLCNQQYHYRTTCQQLPEITQQWFLWCQTERARYLTMRAEQDAAYAARLADYNRQKNENENRNRDLRRRYEELMNDEQYKAQHCRLCPSCKRVVQRLEGCDKMVCGQDAHGGNVQSGCGTKFNWAQAHPYSAAAALQPKQTMNDLPKPDKPVLQHIGFKCDECQNDIHGIRFDCVHCPTLSFCEKCEQQSTLKHSRENQRDEKQQHVFRLIMIPST